MYADFSSILADKVWLVIGFVVGVSMLLLLLMFRSPVVAVKAALMNLLSVGAAYGVVTAVFQWGWGLDLLGVDHAMPMSSWLPILMFAILFGLSMDYEVFLLSRIREDYDRTGDARGSVARGLAATSGVISAAAAIMVLVFLGFVTESGALIKMLGFGLGVAILLDATVVRLVLVPATMSLLGERNWWTPAWLDRLLPRLAVEAAEQDGERPDERVPEPSCADDDYRERVRICVLGGCRVLDDTGAELDLGSRKPRSVVAALALTPGRPVSADALADLVWGGEPPRTARAPCTRTSPGCAACSSPSGRSAAPPRSSRPPTTGTSCGCRPRRSTRTRSPRRCA